LKAKPATALANQKNLCLSRNCLYCRYLDLRFC